MSDVTPYIFEGSEVRVVMINGEPWWVATDVCKTLGIIDASEAVERLHRDDRDQTRIPMSRFSTRPQGAWVINESGLYELIIRSDKPAAREFRRWITSEVLPQIRKTGGYSQALSPAEFLLRQAQMMVEQERRVIALETRQHAIEAKQSAQDGAHDWFTTLAYAKLNDLPTDRVSCQRHGQRAARAMRSRGQEPIKRQDATFGMINTYSVDVLDETAEFDQ